MLRARVLARSCTLDAFEIRTPIGVADVRIVVLLARIILGSITRVTMSTARRNGVCRISDRRRETHTHARTYTDTHNNRRVRFSKFYE